MEKKIEKEKEKFFINSSISTKYRKAKKIKKAKNNRNKIILDRLFFSHEKVLCKRDGLAQSS